MPKTLAMAALGLFLGTIGIDQMSGFFRFQYGIIELGDGIGVVPVAVGLLGLSEVLLAAGSGAPVGHHDAAAVRAAARPARSAPVDRRRRRAARCSASSIGIVPGSAHIISSFVSYGVERRISQDARGVRQGRGGRRGGTGIGEQRRGVRRIRADAGARRAVGADHRR